MHELVEHVQMYRQLVEHVQIYKQMVRGDIVSQSVYSRGGVWGQDFRPSEIISDVSFTTFDPVGPPLKHNLL